MLYQRTNFKYGKSHQFLGLWTKDWPLVLKLLLKKVKYWLRLKNIYSLSVYFFVQ